MSPFKGIALKLCSVVMFITMVSMIKATLKHVPVGEAVFFRAAFAIPVILIWLAVIGKLRTGLKVNSYTGHFWRGFVGSIAMGTSFAGLGLLPLPEVTALGYAAPLLTVVFAAVLLNESVGPYRFGAVALGLVGVLVVLSPRLSMLGSSSIDTAQAIGAGLVLMGAVGAALAQVYIRMLVKVESTSAIVFYFSISSAVFSLLTLPFGWVVPTGPELLLLMSAGILGGAGQIFLTSAYRFADASVVAPFDYASMLFALLIGFFVFDEVPTTTMLTGAAIVILAGFIIIWREAHLGLRRGRARSLKTPQG